MTKPHITGPILVTGASGNLGGAVVRALTSLGMPIRLAGTSPTSLQRRYPDAEAVRLDFHDPATFAPALEGAGGVFLVRPPAIATVGPTLNAMLDVAERSRVGHVVFSSVAGAEQNRAVPHHRVESHLRASSLSWTILRPGFFAQNLADAYRDDIRDDDRLYLPAGLGEVAFIDTRDVGAAAAAVFAETAVHRGAGYLLTGPARMSFHEVASVLGRELDRTITYEPASAVAYLRHVHRQGRSWTQAAVQTMLHLGVRRGQAELVDPTLAQLLGRAPRTLEQYIREHRARWARQDAPPT